MIYPLQILKDVVETYEGEFGTLNFYQGFPSGLNKVKNLHPFVWVMESTDSITSERIQQGLFRVRVRFLVLRTTADRSSGKPQSSTQANDADITLATAEMDAIANQLAYYLQYDTPIIGYTGFSWSSSPVAMQASGLFSGVLVTASMMMRDPVCREDFDYPAGAPPQPQRVATPEFGVPEGEYVAFVDVPVTTDTDGAELFYTLDGSFPTQNSTPVVDGVVRLTASGRLRVVGVKENLLNSAVANFDVSIVPISISFLPVEGEYLGGIDVALVPNTLVDAIHFTTDGSEPTTDSPIVTGEIPVGVITEIQAIGVIGDFAQLIPSVAQFDIKALAPTVTPASGTFENEQEVDFDNPNPLGDVWASLNGGAFQIVTDEVFDEITSYVAEVRHEGYVTSQQVSGTINIQCAPVTFSPNGGEFENTTGEITLSTTTPDASIYYTTDGSEPTELSTLYNPLAKPALTQSGTLKAKAFKANLLASATTQASFIVSAKFALVGNAGAGTQRLYQSVNDGAAWTEVQPFGNESRFYIDSQISDIGASVLIVEGANGQNVRISKDTLQTWQTPTFPSSLVSSAIFRGTADGGIFIACANIGNARNQILVSTDGGLNFVDRSPSLATFNFCEISPDGTTMYAFKSSISNLDNIIVYRSTDLGLNWTAVYTLANRRVTFASCSDEAAYFNVVNQADAAAGIFRLPHDSTTLSDLTTAIGSLGAVSATQRAISVSEDDSVLIAWSFAGTLTRRSTNQGTSFSSVNLTAANARRMNINNIGTKVIVGQTNSIINISTDGGQSYALPATTPGTGTRLWQLADVN